MPDYVGTVVVRLKVPLKMDHIDDPQDPDFHAQRKKAIIATENELKTKLPELLKGHEIVNIVIEVIEQC